MERAFPMKTRLVFLNLIFQQKRPAWISRFGALGLCAFMVFQNYRQSDALGKVITRQDETIEKHHSEIVGLTLNLATALAQNTRALSDMTAGLHDRPCMAKDRTGE